MDSEPKNRRFLPFLRVRSVFARQHFLALFTGVNLAYDLELDGKKNGIILTGKRFHPPRGRSVSRVKAQEIKKVRREIIKSNIDQDPTLKGSSAPYVNLDCDGDTSKGDETVL